MTSSYQFSRRPPRKYTEYESYAINGGICPTGFDTYFYGNHDWKICVPNPHGTTTLNECKCEKKYLKECERWQNGSSNSFAKGCPTPKSGWRTSRATLYDDRSPAEGWLYNQIPYQKRRQLHEPRAMFDRYNYYQLPTRYNGTGYDVLRGWKTPQYALDMVDVPPVWDNTKLMSAQPYPIQNQAKKSREEGWNSLMTNDDAGVMGGFYGDPFKSKDDMNILWDTNQTSKIPKVKKHCNKDDTYELL